MLRCGSGSVSARPDWKVEPAGEAHEAKRGQSIRAHDRQFARLREHEVQCREATREAGEACVVAARIEASAASDADSLSGKAREARGYGIVVVAESWLLERWPGCH